MTGPEPPTGGARLCSFPDCPVQRDARGLCRRHYMAAKRAGMLPPLVPLPDYVVDPSGCWLWVKGLSSTGYAHKSVGGKNGKHVLAHRFYYQMHKGPIPSGLTLDHLCRTPRCVNPDHLEPVTIAENVRRGTGQSAIHAAQTECIHGHPFDEENTYRPPKGGRQCRTCIRQREAKRPKNRVHGAG